jgi:hypothetical protein
MEEKMKTESLETIEIETLVDTDKDLCYNAKILRLALRDYPKLWGIDCKCLHRCNGYGQLDNNLRCNEYEPW